MQLSFFHKQFQANNTDNTVLLFSTKKASIIEIHKETLDDIKNGRLSPEEESILRDLELIVDNIEEEKEEIKSFITEANSLKKELDLTIVTTLDCNFDCTYCFEGDLRQARPYLSNETKNDLEKYVKTFLDSDCDGVFLTYYGGEPLMNYSFIRSFSKTIKDYAEKRGKTFSFSMITNGSLFNRKKAEELAGLGLTHIQTTLDGVKENHNKTRPFTSGKGSFDAIIQNIKETWDIVKINAGGNFEKHTIDKYIELIPFLVDEGLGPDKLETLNFAPVMKSINGYNNGCIRITEDWVIDADLRIRETLLKHCYKVAKPAPIACAIENPNIFVVNYNGDLYKCPPLIGADQFIAGNIKTGPTDYSKAYNVGFWENEKCLNCVYLPMCFGGCRYYSYLRNGNTCKVDCQMDYLDATLEKHIKMDLKYGNI